MGLEHLLQAWSYLSYPEVGRSLHPLLRLVIVASTVAALWLAGRASC